MSTEKNLYKLPTSSLLQMRLSLFAPVNYRIQKDPNKLPYFKHENDYGKITVSNITLTQVHAHVLEVLFNNHKFKPYSDDKGRASCRVQFEAYEFLKQLEWNDSAESYKLLHNVFDDLTNAHVSLLARSKLGGPLNKGMSFNILSGAKWLDAEYSKNRMYEVVVSPYFLEFFDNDLLAYYPDITSRIRKLDKGIVQRMVRFLISQQLNLHESYEDQPLRGWKGSLDKLLDLIGVTVNHINPLTGLNYSHTTISVFKHDFKPVLNAETGELESSSLTQRLKKEFGITFNWITSRNCEICYSKNAFDKTLENKNGAVTFRNPTTEQKKIVPRKVLVKRPITDKGTLVKHTFVKKSELQKQLEDTQKLLTHRKMEIKELMKKQNRACNIAEDKELTALEIKIDKLNEQLKN